MGHSRLHVNLDCRSHSFCGFDPSGISNPPSPQVKSGRENHPNVKSATPQVKSGREKHRNLKSATPPSEKRSGESP